MAKLGDVCEVLNGFAFKSDQYVESGIRIIRIANVQKGYIEDSSPTFYPMDSVEAKKYQLKENDLLMSLTGNVGRVGLLTSNFLPAALNQRVACLRIKDRSILEKVYLFHVLNSDFFEQKCIEFANGVAQKNMSTEWLKEYEIPVPSLDAQRRIAAVLDKVSGLIAKRREQLDKLDELVKARFVEMFGIPGTDKFGWGLIALGTVCCINPKKSEDKRLGIGVRLSFVPMPAVTETGEIDVSAIKTYEEVKTGFTYFAENDVLFAKITPCMENGKGAIAKGLYNGIGFGSTEFHVLRPVSGKTNPYWIYALTMFPQFRVDAENSMTGSAGQRRVPASFLEDYRVAVPPINLQEEFAAFVKETDKSKLTIQQSLDKLEVLKKALMQGYFKQKGF